MGMNADEYREFLDRWLADVELATTTMRISDVAAAILLIGDRLLQEVSRLVRCVDDIVDTGRVGVSALKREQFFTEHGYYPDQDRTPDGVQP